MRLLERKKNMKGLKKMWGMSVSATPLKNKIIWDWIVWIQKNNKFVNIWLAKNYKILKKNYVYV